MSGPRAQRSGSAPAGAALDHDAAAARADRVFVTAHPAEPTTAVLLRAGDTALTSYLDDVLDAPGPPLAIAASGDVGHAEIVAVEPLRRLFARHVRESSPDDAAGELYAEVVAAAAVAALDLAVRTWLAAGAPADAVRACRERFRAVAGLLPRAPGRE